MHSATERAPTPAGSNCCTISSTRPTPAASVCTSPATAADDRFQRFGQVAVVVDRRPRWRGRSRAHPAAGGRARAARPGDPAACGPIRRRARVRRRRCPTRATRIRPRSAPPIRRRSRPRARPRRPRRPRPRRRSSPAGVASADQVASKSSSASSMTFVSSACEHLRLQFDASAAAAGGSPAAAAASSSAAGRSGAGGWVSSCGEGAASTAAPRAANAVSVRVGNPAPSRPCARRDLQGSRPRIRRPARCPG